MADYNDPNKQTPGISPALSDLYGSDALSQFLQGPNAPAQAPQSIGAPPPMMPPQINPQTQPMMSALTNSQPAGGDINIDGWKPHHTTALGKIADIGLAMLGIPMMPFTNHVKKENMQEAMEGFTIDPMNSIRRLAQIPGMQDKAWKLFKDYQQIHQNDAMDAEKLNYYHGMNEDRTSGIIASYLGGIKKSGDPEANYQKLAPQLRAMAEKRGMDQAWIDSVLPDKYDPDLSGTVLTGGVKPVDQEHLSEEGDYHKTQEQLRQEEINQTGAYRGARLNQMDTHEQAYEKHNTNMETIASTRANRVAAGKGRPSYVNTKYGPGEVSPDGNAMRVQLNGMNHFYTKVGPDRWKHVKAGPVDPADKSVLAGGYDGPDPEGDNDEDEVK